jgi:hypothetical protein
MRRQWLGIAVAALVVIPGCGSTQPADQATSKSDKSAPSMATASAKPAAEPEITGVPDKLPEFTDQSHAGDYLTGWFKIMAKYTKGQVKRQVPELIAVTGAQDCTAGGVTLHIGDQVPAAGVVVPPEIAPCVTGGKLVMLYAPAGVAHAATSFDPEIWHGFIFQVWRSYLLQAAGYDVIPPYTMACTYGEIMGGLRDAGYLTDEEATISKNHLMDANSLSAYQDGLAGHCKS